MSAEFPDYDFIDGIAYRKARRISVRKRNGTLYQILSDYSGNRKYWPVSGAATDSGKANVIIEGYRMLSSEYPDYATDGRRIVRVSSPNRSVHKPRLITPQIRVGVEMVCLSNYAGKRVWNPVSRFIDQDS